MSTRLSVGRLTVVPRPRRAAPGSAPRVREGSRARRARSVHARRSAGHRATRAASRGWNPVSMSCLRRQATTSGAALRWSSVSGMGLSNPGAVGGDRGVEELSAAVLGLRDAAGRPVDVGTGRRRPTGVNRRGSRSRALRLDARPRGCTRPDRCGSRPASCERSRPRRRSSGFLRRARPGRRRGPRRNGHGRGIRCVAPASRREPRCRLGRPRRAARTGAGRRSITTSGCHRSGRRAMRPTSCSSSAAVRRPGSSRSSEVRAASSSE